MKVKIQNQNDNIDYFLKNMIPPLIERSFSVRRSFRFFRGFPETTFFLTFVSLFLLGICFLKLKKLTNIERTSIEKYINFFC